MRALCADSRVGLDMWFLNYDCVNKCLHHVQECEHFEGIRGWCFGAARVRACVTALR